MYATVLGRLRAYETERAATNESSSAMMITALPTASDAAIMAKETKQTLQPSNTYYKDYVYDVRF